MVRCCQVGRRTPTYPLGIVKPAPEARYVVFYSFAEGSEGGVYYDVHTIQNMRHGLTLLAYEMNGASFECASWSSVTVAMREPVGLQDG